MLPVARIAAGVSSYDSSIPDMNAAAPFPAGVRPGDHVYLLMAFASSTIAVDEGSSRITGWTEFLNVTQGDNRIIVYRCIVDDSTDLETGPDFGLTETGVKGGGAVLAYRNLEDLAALDSAVVGAVGGSSGSFTTPSVDLSRYSDLLIAAVFYRGDDDLLDSAENALVTTGLDGDDFLGLFSVYEFVPNVAGASAAHAFDYEGSAVADYGAALAFVLASPAVEVSPTYALDPPGTIGLPVKGI